MEIYSLCAGPPDGPEPASVFVPTINMGALTCPRGIWLSTPQAMVQSLLTFSLSNRTMARNENIRSQTQPIERLPIS